MKTYSAVIAIALAAFVLRAATNQTYTVRCVTFETTNAIEVIHDHEKKIPPCTLIRYVENGKTNEYHAWAIAVQVITNK